MITRLNLDTLVAQGYDYIMGVKLRQDSLFQMLLEQDKLDWESANFDEQLKLLEHTVSVKEFLLWKTSLLLITNGLTINDEGWQNFAYKIGMLTDNDTPTVSDFRSILEALSDSMTTKIRSKIWTLIKRYSGHYELTNRFICCLNPERQASANAYREKKLDQLGEELDKLFAKVTDSKKKNKFNFDKEIGKIFAGFRSKFKKFFKFEKQTSYSRNTEVIAQNEKYDGVFVILFSFPKSKLT